MSVQSIEFGCVCEEKVKRGGLHELIDQLFHK